MTTGRIKNSAKRLSFSFSNKEKISQSSLTLSRMVPSLLRMKLQVFLVCVCVCVRVCFTLRLPVLTPEFEMGSLSYYSSYSHFSLIKAVETEITKRLQHARARARAHTRTHTHTHMHTCMHARTHTRVQVHEKKSWSTTF